MPVFKGFSSFSRLKAIAREARSAVRLDTIALMQENRLLKEMVEALKAERDEVRNVLETKLSLPAIVDSILAVVTIDGRQLAQRRNVTQ